MYLDSSVMGILIAPGYGAEGDWWDMSPAAALVVGPLLGIIAGVGEEVLLVGALVVVAERAGWSATRLYLVAGIARLAFHLYDGLAAVVMLPWALLSVWLFRRTRTVAPLIACHTLWNTALFWPEPLGLALFWAVPSVGTALLVLTWRRRTTPVHAA